MGELRLAVLASRERVRVLVSGERLAVLPSVVGASLAEFKIWEIKARQEVVSCACSSNERSEEKSKERSKKNGNRKSLIMRVQNLYFLSILDDFIGNKMKFKLMCKIYPCPEVIKFSS